MTDERVPVHLPQTGRGGPHGRREGVDPCDGDHRH